MPIGTSDGYQFDDQWQMVAHNMGEVELDPLPQKPVTGPSAADLPTSADEYKKQADQIFNPNWKPYEDFRQSTNFDDRRNDANSKYTSNGSLGDVYEDPLSKQAGVLDLAHNAGSYYDNPYKTKLSDDDEQAFQAMYGSKPELQRDYDLRGYFKDNPNSKPEEGQHFPDTYKMPSHITFSDESKYHGVDGNEGGHWSKDKESGMWGFSNGTNNRAYYTDDEMKEYFNKYEPDALLLPRGVKDINELRETLQTYNLKLENMKQIEKVDLNDTDPMGPAPEKFSSGDKIHTISEGPEYNKWDEALTEHGAIRIPKELDEPQKWLNQDYIKEYIDKNNIDRQDNDDGSVILRKGTPTS